ncbi:unnamed protein product [Sphagnum troendelagicum]|uniref:Protein kinase domain-containing protein n=1 Tax=Sphagnum troendelagicum TaxID=128251 RepID=A0ABP0TSF9_9BRYO
MADAHDCSSSGLDKGPNGVGQVTHFLSATRSLLIGNFRNFFRFRNRELLNDETTSSTGEYTYYSTAPQELWTELLSKDLQDLNFVSKIQNDEGESSCVEVHELEQRDLVLREFLAEGGQAHVYFAECETFSTPVVVKRLKHGNVDMYELRSRMEMLMKTRRKNNSAICTVFGVGDDSVGNVWVVMERMAGDLRTLIDRRMSYLEDGQMPFDYNNTITMMMHIAQGMEDLHRCGLIHADLKASNILVTPVIMDPREVEVDGSQQVSESLYFYVKIGDFESSDGVVGTRFWRAPEVLRALSNDAKPILSPAADVYSYGMLCYELLTGRIPFEKCARSDYNVVLSGQRPELPAHVNLTMKELLCACWRTEPRERPGWTWIIETLKEERILHPPGSQQPKRRARPRIEMKREEIQAAATTLETSSLVVIPWEEVVAQGFGMEAFATWKEKVLPKILPEVLPIVKVILALLKAEQQDTYDFMMDDDIITAEFECRVKITFSEVLTAFYNAWHVVKDSWIDHVGRESGRYARMRTVRNDASEPYNLLGPTAKCWLNEFLATSKEWQAFRETLHAWHSENEGVLQRWKEELQGRSSDWKMVCLAFHAWHVKSPIAFIARQAVMNKYRLPRHLCREDMKSKCWEDMKSKFLLDVMVAKIYLEECNGPKLKATMRSIKCWKAFELEEVTIRRLFLKKTIHNATHRKGFCLRP